MNSNLMNGQEDLATTVDQESTLSTGSETTTDTPQMGDATEGPNDPVALSADPTAFDPSTDSPSPETRPARRGRGSKASSQKPSTCQMIELERGKIYDEHPLVRETRKKYTIAPREWPVSTITPAVLINLAEHSPLRVVAKDDRYYCIGGLRLYRLLRYDLPADTRLNVILQDGMSDKGIQNQILFDLYAMPIICGLSMKDRRVLGTFWGSEDGLKLFNEAFGCDDAKVLAKLLGCDSRTLKQGKK